MVHQLENGGEYWHFGLSKVVLTVVLENMHKSDIPSKLILNFNIDGLPIGRSSIKDNFGQY